MPLSDKGILYIIGTGPGNPGQMTGHAIAAIQDADVVIGNNFYLEQLGPLLEGKEIIRSSMGKEVERAQHCIERAKTQKVAMVSGGDPGIYGMASIVLEVLEHSKETIEWEVIPGISAANAAASRLGSPLSGDFVTLSLSDLLTPLEVIAHRLDHAFQMGVPVTLYNPKSRGRPHNLDMALDVALQHRHPDTPVGIVKNTFRDGEEEQITTLAALRKDNSFVDMHCMVIIAGEEARITQIGNRDGIITPRGYDRKYVY